MDTIPQMYMSVLLMDLKFSKAKNSGSLNSIYDEQCVGIYDDGAKIFVYIDNFATGEKGNIYEAERKGLLQ